MFEGGEELKDGVVRVAVGSFCEYADSVVAAGGGNHAAGRPRHIIDGPLMMPFEQA